MKRVVNLIRDATDNVRIAIAYPEFERSARREWHLNAARLFATDRLKREITARVASAISHSTHAYDHPVGELRAKRNSVQSVVTEAEEFLAILSREYAGELASAYARLKGLRDELEVCKENLSLAYERMNSAKASLDAWYSEAESNWFGNGGRELPKRAIFGQDLSERDSYKSERDSAGELIGQYREERQALYDEIRKVKDEIGVVKTARQAKIDLRKSGFDKRLVESTIKNGMIQLRDLDQKALELQEAREVYIRKAKFDTGVDKLEAQILALHNEHAAYVRRFDSDEMKAERKARHAQQWRDAHGRS